MDLRLCKEVEGLDPGIVLSDALKCICCRIIGDKPSGGG